MVTARARPRSKSGKAPSVSTFSSNNERQATRQSVQTRGRPGAFYAAGPAISFGTPIQPKLTVNPPGDEYEQEADRVADTVMRTSTASSSSRPDDEHAAGTVQTNAIVQRQSADEMGEDEESDGVQTRLVTQRQSEGAASVEDEEVTLQTLPVIQRLCPACEAALEAQSGEIAQRQADESTEEEQSAPSPAFGPEEEDIGSAALQMMPATSRVRTSANGRQQVQRAAELPAIPENVTPEEEVGAEAGETTGVTAESEPMPEEGEEDATVALPEPQPLSPDEEEAPPIQMHGNGVVPAPRMQSVEQTLGSTRGGGHAMEPSLQAEMEEGFGRDLSDVRIHTDDSAARMNRDLQAKAFTHQSNVYFGAGEYRPHTASGKRLLAHELTHTIQQGGGGDGVQRFTAPPHDVTVEGKPDRPDDGGEVEGRMNAKIADDPNVKKQGEASEEEKEQLKNPDRGEVRSESSQVQGEARPAVDRGADAQEKIADQKAQIDEQVEEEADEASEEEGEGESAEAPLSDAEAAAQRAEAAEAQAAGVEVPAEPQPFRHPRITAPVDSAGESLPRNGQIDTQVRGLGYIGEMLRVKGYQMKQHAADKMRGAWGLEAVVEKEREDLANAREGTDLIEAHTEARKEIAELSHEAHAESVSRQQFVAEKAPDLAGKADEGQAESGELAGEARSKAGQSEGEIPDDPDAAADAREQAGEMSSSAEGAESMDEAIRQTGARARQYEADASMAAEQNEQSDVQISETEDVIEQTEARVDEMHAINDASQEQIESAAGGPALIRRHAQRTAQSGDELIAATIVMEAELESIQEEYLSGMAAIESREAAVERQQREQEEAGRAEMSPEEERLFELAGMSDEEQERRVAEMEQPERDGLLAALDRMIQTTPDQGTEATEGARLRVDTGLAETIRGEQPVDPRAEQIQGVENRRIERVGGVLDVADRNMTFLTEAQQRILAERLVAESITDDVKNINVLQLGKDMIAGMIDPRQSLASIVGGFEKMATGFANIGNLEAWRRDPLGNLLQIAADVATGLAMIFSTILGLAAIITAIMVVLTILSWGFLSPITGPVIGWMGTVMTYAGWGAIIAGSLSVYFNYLAYIKNLHDAGTAETARELFGNTEQMKQNVTDGFQGAMAVVEGVGAVKMGPALSSGQFFAGVPRSPGAFAGQVMQAGRAGISALALAPAAVARGARMLFSGGRRGLIRFKERVQRLFSRRRPGDADVRPPAGRRQQSTPDGRHHTSVTPDGRIVRCSERCTLMRREFDAELNRRGDLKRKLDEIEELGKTNPDAANVRAAQLEVELRQAREIRNLSRDQLEARIRDTPKTNNPGDLSNALRYERYRRRRGKAAASYDEWFSGSRGGRPGSPMHQADVTANNGPPNNLVPRAVGNRVADGVGRPGQTVKLRGQDIKPQGNGRVIVESDHTIRNGAMPNSEARAQMRDMRAADPNATLVVTDLGNPSAPPLVYPPGTQPPPPGRLSPGQKPIVPYPET